MLTLSAICVQSNSPCHNVALLLLNAETAEAGAPGPAATGPGSRAVGLAEGFALATGGGGATGLSISSGQLNGRSLPHASCCLSEGAILISLCRKVRTMCREEPDNASRRVNVV